MNSANQTHPILYSFRRCPYAMRARMALMASQSTCELREILLRNKPAQMLAISEKGTVPVLQLSDGTVIDESLDVMYWALRCHDSEHWLDADESETADLIARNDDSFKAHLDHYKYHVNHLEHPQQYYREQGEVFLSELDKRLAQRKGKGLISTRHTLADIAIFPFIRQFSRVDLTWFEQSPYEHLQQWLAGLEQGALYQSVMSKYPVWAEGDAITLFATELPGSQQI